ncbi:hypothetical protein CSQ96_27600 [Janthinobacterium sp. BJB412]|nr:hypothetical protein CSQ96_27600 [Janthinobacterium sp. BJB412]
MSMRIKFLAAHNRTRRVTATILIIVIGALWWLNDSSPVLAPPFEKNMPLQSCIGIRPEFGPYQEAEIETSGLYCAEVDFWQRRLSDGAGHHGPAPYRHLLEVAASDVILDLARHTLHSDGDSSGIVAWRERKEGRPMPQNITIRNGVIDIRGLGTAVSFIDRWPMNEIDKPAPEDFPGFKKTTIILENLLIKTDNVGIMLEGDGNIIRNCIIESDGDSAIMMAGRNGQIFNNRIILTEPFRPTWLSRESYLDQLTKLHEFRKIPRAAIALHRATGTVIRGNRIEVKGKSETRHNIYLTDTSIGVQIEGNTFIGTDAPVTLMNGSTANLKNNTYEQRLPWWRFSDKAKEKRSDASNRSEPVL